MLLALLVVVVLLPVLAFNGIGSGRRVYGAVSVVTAMFFVAAFIHPGAEASTLAAVSSFVARSAVAVFIGSLLGVCFFRKRHQRFRSLSREGSRNSH